MIIVLQQAFDKVLAMKWLTLNEELQKNCIALIPHFIQHLKKQ